MENRSYSFLLEQILYREGEWKKGVKRNELATGLMYMLEDIGSWIRWLP